MPAVLSQTLSAALRGDFIEDNLQTKVALGKVQVCSACALHCGNLQNNKRHSFEGIMGEDRESAETGAGKKGRA